LFSRAEDNIQWHQTRYTYPQISESDHNGLKDIISNMEVKNALFTMSPWKAPGPDGFPAGFYQNGWRDMGSSICDFVKYIWSNPMDVASVNFTDICLIPKVDRPELVSQFRPISLCNVSYKIITKIMVNRLKTIIPQIVSPFQTGFVPGRNITENVVIAQEMLHSMTKMRSTTGFFVIKVDLSKAYDRLRWFIHKVLIEVKLPDVMINLIMNCITSVQSNVLWNGNRSDFFKPQCGVRQGDPISPYLFVLCMDKLSHLIAEATENGKWKPMRAGRNGPLISHLMFADDLLLFGQAVDENMRAVMEVLNNFCAMSGQQVNYDKSSIFFSRNVSNGRRTVLSTQSGLKETQHLGKYLGVPALGRAPRVQDFQYLVEKIKGKLAGWKAQQLSLAGRITLAKSVIQATPIYPMMSTPIPKSCLQEIEKAQRDFIWGDTDDKRKAHMISWNTITRAKDCGGLGLRKLQSMNEACLMKMGWSLMTREDTLWGNVLIGKYGREGWNQGRICSKTNDSSLWKAITKCWPKLELYSCWSIGDGNKVNFWSDKWIDAHTRVSDLVHHIPEEVQGWKVKDIAAPTGEWNFDKIKELVPNSIVQKMHAIVPPHASHDNDIQFWPGTNTGHFTVAAAYRLITGGDMHDGDKKWSQIWKINSMERVRVFIWQMVHDRLKTKARLASWQIGDSCCNTCLLFDETTLHVLRDCPIAANVWHHLLTVHDRGQFFVLNFNEWIKFNLENRFGQNHGSDWQAIWATTCFLLWQWRNKSIHDAEFVSPMNPWQVSLNYVNMYKISMQAEERIQHSKDKQHIDVKWLIPSPGWFVMNSDGAAKMSVRKAGCGGVLRNDIGIWVEGFSKALGDTTAYMAELWGIYEGLCIAHRRGVVRLELRTDSQVIAQSLQNSTSGSVMGGALMKKIRSLMNGAWEIRIIHVFREANRCADALADMGCDGISGIAFFASPPSRVRQIVEDDARGVCCPRLIYV
jgi:ribonuclease HI